MNIIGQSLGRYHILEQLGEGGMATVYKAFDTRLETDVAVKVIRTENLTLGTMERALKRFEREAKALARLTHPNIVKVTDYGEYEGKPYLVMEYLPGGTLKERLVKPIAWQEAVRMLIPIAEALDFAHRQNMIHRDVKPSNILITADGDPMLTDFGIAKILDLEETQELTGTSAAVGTPEYMAPEQTHAKTVDHRVDIYALGIVLYEMITGRKPYVADTPMAVLIMQARDPLPSPRSFVPGLPVSVERMLLKALAKDPADRYATMGEIASAMEYLLSGTGAIEKDGYLRSSPRRGQETHAERGPRRQTADILGSMEQKRESLTIRDQPVKELPARKLSTPRARMKTPWIVLGGVIFVIILISGLLDWALGGGADLFSPHNTISNIISTLTFTPISPTILEDTSTPIIVIKPTPVFAKIDSLEGGGARVRKSPGGDYLLTLSNGDIVEVLGETEEASGVIWEKIVVEHGGERQEGWIIQSLLATVTLVIETSPPTPVPGMESILTPTPVPFISTPEKMFIRISITANCRGGPGVDYPILAMLSAGWEYEVVGQESTGQYWIVRNPENPSTLCWVSSSLGRILGDSNSLPIFTWPP